MGCLKRIFSIIVLIFAYIGFQSVGGIQFCKDFITDFNKPKQEKITASPSDFFDTAKLSDDYEISKDLSFWGTKYIEVDYQKEPQKIYVIDSNGFLKISKDDFASGKIEDVLQNTISKFAYSAIRLENPRVIRTGRFDGLNQKIPYVLFKADVVRGTVPEMVGMIGVIEGPDGKNDIIFSYATVGPYNQEVTERFFKKVKYGEEI